MSVSDRVVTISDSLPSLEVIFSSGGASGGLVVGESFCHGSDRQAGIDADVGGNTGTVHHEQPGMTMDLMPGIDH